MWITALDTFDNRQEGDTFECPDAQAQKLIAKGLAMKAKPEHANKMAAEGHNKANPTQGAGKAPTLPSSQAGQASPQPTVDEYPGGGLVKPDPAIAAAEAAEAQALAEKQAAESAEQSTTTRTSAPSSVEAVEPPPTKGTAKAEPAEAVAGATAGAKPRAPRKAPAKAATTSPRKTPTRRGG